MDNKANNIKKEDVQKELRILLDDVIFSHKLGAYPRGSLVDVAIDRFVDPGKKGVFDVCITIFPLVVDRKDVEGVTVCLNYYGRSSEHKDLWENAARALGKTGSPEVVQALMDALKPREYKDAWEDIAGALGNIGSPEAVQALVDALKCQSGRYVGHYFGTTNHRGQIYLADLPEGTYEAEVLVSELIDASELSQLAGIQFGTRGFYKDYILFQGHLRCVLREDENNELVADLEETDKGLELKIPIIRFSFVNSSGESIVSLFALLHKHPSTKKLYTTVNVETILRRHYESLPEPRRNELGSPRSLIPDDPRIHVSIIENIESLLSEDIDELKHSILASLDDPGAIHAWKDILNQGIEGEYNQEIRQKKTRLLEYIKKIIGDT